MVRNLQILHKDTVETRFIKNLLKNTYLPTLPTIHNGDYMLEGVEYIYKNDIIKCTSTGLFVTSHLSSQGVKYVPRSTGTGTAPAAGQLTTCGKAFLCGGGLTLAKFKTVQTFVSNKYTPGVTSPYVASSRGYDSETHKYLGRYLRWYRDSSGIDLMGLYNNFAGDSTSLIHLENGLVKDGTNNQTISWIVPAHLNTTYTIYLNSHNDVTVRGVFLNQFSRVINDNFDGKYLDTLFDTNVVSRSGPKYTRPFTYSTVTANPLAFNYINNFYLLIETAYNHTGPIVVLEGDYTSSNQRFVVSNEYIETGDNEKIIPPIKPSLGVLGSLTPMLYSNRLIEFLTQNVISPDEDIPLNVHRIQQNLRLIESYDYRKDVWSDIMRYLLYNQYFSYTSEYYFDTDNPTTTEITAKNIPSKNAVYEIDPAGITPPKLVGTKNCKPKRDFDTSYDITGYVDKDVENSLYRYRSI